MELGRQIEIIASLNVVVNRKKVEWWLPGLRGEGSGELLSEHGVSLWEDEKSYGEMDGSDGYATL